MQRRYLCAFSVVCSLGFLPNSVALAGPTHQKSYHQNGQGKAHARAHHGHPSHAHVRGPEHVHKPVIAQHMSVGGSPASIQQFFPRPLPGLVGTPVVVLPLNPVFPPPRQILGLAPEPTYPLSPPIISQTARYHAPEPSSFVPTDPRAVISELPSGRIFMGAPQGVYYPQQHGRKWSRTYDSGPYAPPSVQIIGDLPRKHMGGPVRLTHGTPAPRRFETGPKVIWIKAERAEAQSSSPHVRYIK
jgi:hypothetical protein